MIYREPMDRTRAMAQAEKRADRERTGYVPACDDLYCNLCRKARGERAPWNRKDGR